MSDAAPPGVVVDTMVISWLGVLASSGWISDPFRMHPAVGMLADQIGRLVVRLAEART
jgi:hypothetical protein